MIISFKYLYKTPMQRLVLCIGVDIVYFAFHKYNISTLCKNLICSFNFTFFIYEVSNFFTGQQQYSHIAIQRNTI